MNAALTAEELRAVKFYEGDVPEGNDPFWGDRQAYVSLNALLFDGLQTEYTRTAEGKRLNPAVLADIPRLLSVYAALFSAAAKCARSEPLTGFRVERERDFSACAAAGRTLAFTSACTDGFLSAYGDKRGILLLRYDIPAGTPCILFREALDSYLKYSENEVLLPPGLAFTAVQRPLTEEESRITDLEHKPPLAAYNLRVRGKTALPDFSGFPSETPSAGVSIWNAVNAGTPESALPEQAKAEFLAWKRELQRRVRGIAEAKS